VIGGGGEERENSEEQVDGSIRVDSIYGGASQSKKTGQTE
jgi:hypothetical protein